MTTPFTYQEPVIEGTATAFLPPRGWWTVDDVVMRGDDDPELVYLVSSTQFGSPLERRDTSGRLLLEAMTALQIGPSVNAVRRYWETRRRKPHLRRAQGPLLRACRDLVALVETFGPVGVAWGAELPVSVDGETGWIADFDGLGPGRFGIGRLRRVSWMPPSTEFWTRIASDRSRRSDRLVRLGEELVDLVAAVRLAAACKDATVSEPGLRELCRAAVEGRPTHGIPLDLARTSDWRQALRREPRDGILMPFGRDRGLVRWRVFANLEMAELITRQLNWLQLRAEATEAGITRSVRATSLLEFAYYQLLDHLRRTDFGIGWCPRCGGAILRTRRPGPTQNRTHAACGDADRQARSVANRDRSQS